MRLSIRDAGVSTGAYCRTGPLISGMVRMTSTQGVGTRIWPVGGEMAARIRAFDWASTPLGSIEGWPERLRTLVDLVLDSNVMMSLMWGRGMVQIYNDAYAEGIGER